MPTRRSPVTRTMRRNATEKRSGLTVMTRLPFFFISIVPKPTWETKQFMREGLIPSIDASQFGNTSDGTHTQF